MGLLQNMTTHVWWRRAALSFCAFCVLLLGAVGCGGGNVCLPCTPGAQTCTQDKKFIKGCQPQAGTQCYVVTLKPCATGTTCGVSGGVTSCQSPTGPTCPTPSCQIGAASCQGNVLALCQRDAVTGCPLQVTQSCTAGQICNAAAKACTTQNCAPTDAQFALRCDTANNAVYWYDDCGNKRDPKQQCQAGETCVDAQCKSGSCQPTNTQASQKCVGNALHWFDNCGTQGAKIQDCPAGQTCTNGACTGGNNGCNNTCSAPDQSVCEGSNQRKTCLKDSKGCMMWGPIKACPSGQSCNNGVCEDPSCPGRCPTLNATKCDGTQVSTCVQGSTPGCLRWSTPQDCPSGACTNNQCPASCNNQCTEGQVLCSGDGYQECAKDAQGCLKWSGQKMCPSGQACQNNKCEPKAAAGSLGAACTQNSDCQTNVCLRSSSTGMGVCSASCSPSSACTSIGGTCVRINGQGPFCVAACSGATASCGGNCVQGYCLP